MKGRSKKVCLEIMSFPDQVSDHQNRCQPHLLKLRMLARGEAETPLAPHITSVVRDATNAVIAEAEAAGRAFLAVSTGGRGQPEPETFLWVRLTRLARAADDAVNAARTGDTSGLRDHLARFGALTTAFWTVQQAVYDLAPAVPGARPLPSAAM
jgi:hypothetical protein